MTNHTPSKKIWSRMSISTTTGGFTLLFAVLVSVLVLAVGTSIINLSLKQIILSGASRESVFAFYAANAGVECAYFWDLNPPDSGVVFATSSNSDLIDGVDEDGVVCASPEGSGRSLYDEYPSEDMPGLSIDSATPDSAVTTFWLTFDPLPYCAYVMVQKTYDNSDPNDPVLRTRIDSYGYNTCDSDNPRRIERGLRVNY